jgi:hypothetical protein
MNFEQPKKNLLLKKFDVIFEAECESYHESPHDQSKYNSSGVNSSQSLKSKT